MILVLGGLVINNFIFGLVLGGVGCGTIELHILLVDLIQGGEGVRFERSLFFGDCPEETSRKLKLVALGVQASDAEFVVKDSGRNGEEWLR